MRETTIRPHKIYMSGILFVALNAIDTFLTFMAVGSGGKEVGLLYKVTDNLTSMSFAKMGLAVLIAWALVNISHHWERAGEILFGLNIGFLGICLWNLWVIQYG